MGLGTPAAPPQPGRVAPGWWHPFFWGSALPMRGSRDQNVHRGLRHTPAPPAAEGSGPRCAEGEWGCRTAQGWVQVHGTGQPASCPGPRAGEESKIWTPPHFRDPGAQPGPRARGLGGWGTVSQPLPHFPFFGRTHLEGAPQESRSSGRTGSASLPPKPALCSVQRPWGGASGAEEGKLGSCKAPHPAGEGLMQPNQAAGGRAGEGDRRPRPDLNAGS